MNNLKYIFFIFFVNAFSVQSQYKTIDVGFTNTVHLIFTSSINDFDVGLGSVGEHHDILVEKSGDKRLKLAAGIKHFTPTNLFVETDDGYYNFILKYSDNPNPLLIEVKQEEAKILKKTETAAILEEKAKQEKKENEDLRNKSLKVINKREQSYLHANSSLGITFTLNSIYVEHDKLYFKFTVQNNSNVKYEIGYFEYLIHKKGKGKRGGVVSDKIINPLFSLIEFDELLPGQSKNTVCIFEKFTLEKKKRVKITLWEKAGERKIEVIAKPTQIVKAKKL